MILNDFFLTRWTKYLIIKIPEIQEGEMNLYRYDDHL